MALFVGGLGAIALMPTASETSTMPVVTACAEPTGSHEAVEASAACRASELADVLGNLPPVPTVSVTETETVTATATVTETVTPSPTADPEPTGTVIGVSAPAAEWDQRVIEVGTCGLEGRRVFDSQLDSTGAIPSTVGDAVDAGMLVVYSFKVPSTGTTAYANALRGDYDSWVVALRDRLAAFNVPMSVTYHHEPNPDMTGATFRALNKRYAPLLQADPDIKFGPILNGWLLDNQQTTFGQYLDQELLDTWDFVGIDTYDSGTSTTNPGSIGAGERVPKLETWLTGRGYPDMPIAVGEYNGWTAERIAASGEAMLSSERMWYALLFNSANGAKGNVLDTPQEIAAFKGTKEDPRALHDPAC